MKRLLLFVVVAAIALLLAEGALSLLAGRSLLDRRAAPESAVPGGGGAGTGTDTGGGVRDAERERAAANNPGIYRVHTDPLVGYVLRTRADLAIHDGTIRSDDLGLRVRPGGPAPDGALRVAVLGDSVAFGFGLDDDQTLAHVLERELTAARGPDAPPVAARTVAIPGWNHRNAIHFLRDHWDRLRPELVLYVPVANDLFDTDSVFETGHRRWAPDPAADDPWLRVYQGGTWRFAKRALGDLSPEAIEASRTAAGAPALVADLSRESSGRYDADAAAIVELAAFLRERGGRLVVAPYVDVPFTWHLLARVHAADPSIPLLPLFSRVGAEFTLPTDAHPRAGTVAAAGRRVARELLRRGLVDGDPSAVPADDPAYDPTRPPTHTPADWARLAAEQRLADAERLVDTIHLETLVGLSQIYGGITDSGLVGHRALFLLGRGAGPLRIVARGPGRADLVPMTVTVEVDGEPVGAFVLEDPHGEAPAVTFPLPPGDGPIEVRLVPDRWGARDDRGTTEVFSFGLIELTTRP